MDLNPYRGKRRRGHSREGGYGCSQESPRGGARFTSIPGRMTQCSRSNVQHYSDFADMRGDVIGAAGFGILSGEECGRDLGLMSTD